MMGEFAPMKCDYCGSGPFSGATMGDGENDPHARTRTYDCGTRLEYDELSHIVWNPSEKCADTVFCERDEARAVLKDIAGAIPCQDYENVCNCQSHLIAIAQTALKGTDAG